MVFIYFLRALTAIAKQSASGGQSFGIMGKIGIF